MAGTNSVRSASQGSSSDLIPDPIDLMIESSKKQRGLHTNPDSKDTFVPQRTQRGIFSPSGVIQTLAAIFSPVAYKDGAKKLEGAWGKVYELDTLTDTHNTTVNNLNRQLTRTQRKLANANTTLSTEGAQLQTTQIPAKNAQYQAARGVRDTRKLALDTAKAAKTQATSAAQTALQEVDNSVPQFLRTNLAAQEGKVHTWTQRLESFRKGTKTTVARYKNEGFIQSQIDSAGKNVRDIKTAIEHAKDPAKVQALKVANRAKSTATLQVAAKTKTFEAARKTSSGLAGEVKELSSDLRYLKQRPATLTTRVAQIGQEIADEGTKLGQALATSKADRITAVGNLASGKGGALASAAAESDDFSRVAATTTKYFGEAGDKMSKALVFESLQKAAGFIGKALTVIGAAFAAIDVGKCFYDAITASDEDKKGAWTRAIFNGICTLGGTALGFAIGGPVGAMIGASFGNMAYTLVNSIVNQDFNHMFKWLWGTA